MKHLRKFENFGQDLGRFGQESSENPYVFSSEETQETDPFYTEEEEKEREDFAYASHDGGFGGDDSEESEKGCKPCGEEKEEEEEEMDRPRVWGDEATYVENFQSFFEKKKAKPDFLDLDKDGDKKESMKKAAKDAKEKDKKEDKNDDKKEEKGKGLSASQKKLPPALQKAILAKKNK